MQARKGKRVKGNSVRRRRSPTALCASSAPPPRPPQVLQTSCLRQGVGVQGVEVELQTTKEPRRQCEKHMAGKWLQGCGK